MPFQSEKQRRYLWANEPEIARDWTDTYGSKIQAADGGIMRLGFYNGGPGPGGQGARGQATQNPGRGGGPPSGGSGGPGGPMYYQAPQGPHIDETQLQSHIINMGAPPGMSTTPTYTHKQPNFLQRIGEGVGNIASGVGNYIQSGGMTGAIMRGLGSLFGPSVPSTGNVGPAGLKTDNTYGTLEDAKRTSLRNQKLDMDRRQDMPVWAKLGYPSYQAFLLAQSMSGIEGIEGIEGIDIDETEVDDFVQRFRVADEYRQNPYTVDTPIKYT